MSRLMKKNKANPQSIIENMDCDTFLALDIKDRLETQMKEKSSALKLEVDLEAMKLVYQEYKEIKLLLDKYGIDGLDSFARSS